MSTGIPNEVGSLRRSTSGVTSFVGSSSGIYFLGTVRRAFANAGAPPALHQDSPLTPGSQLGVEAEECIAGDDEQDESEGENNRNSHENVHEADEPHSSTARGDLILDYTTARSLATIYFKSWHPLLPFIHGPTFIHDLQTFCSHHGEIVGRPGHDRAQVIILQCILSIASLDSAESTNMQGSFRITSTERLVSVLGSIALRSDIQSIQALLAAQLYLVAIMSLRAASTVGGLLIRSLFKAGLHRCPYRYHHLSEDEKEIRKRIFWSAYALDRFLSQTLGHPLSVQDSDIDLCFPGLPECHQSVAAETNLPGASMALASSRGIEDDVESHRPSHPRSTSHLRSTSHPRSTSRTRPMHSIPDRQATLANFVRCARLTGQVVELFHKSIAVRSINHKNVLSLKADIDEWWNSQPMAMEYNPSDATAPATSFPSLGAFFSVWYHHLILLTNRPYLSADPSSAEFRSAIQVCVAAETSIVSILKSQLERGQRLFWPGYMSLVWMSGLIVAFASQQNLYPAEKAARDLSICLRLLDAMAARWKMARHCRNVLSSLTSHVNTDVDLHVVERRPVSGVAANEGEYRPNSSGPQSTSSRTTSRPHKRPKLHHAPSTPVPNQQDMRNSTSNLHQPGHNTTNNNNNNFPNLGDTGTHGSNHPNSSATSIDDEPLPSQSHHSSIPNPSRENPNQTPTHQPPNTHPDNINREAQYPTRQDTTYRDGGGAHADAYQFETLYSMDDIFQGASWESLLDDFNATTGFDL